MSDAAVEKKVDEPAPAEKTTNGTSEKPSADAVAPKASNGVPAESKVDPKSRTVLSQQRADENAKKIAAQIEYYLGDFNLIQDKFFRDLVQKEEGWVPIDAIMKCNRVKKYTSNPADVIPSLQKFSTTFDLDETGMKIKRKEAFTGDTDELRQARDDRTVHVKRFLKSATIDTMQDHFAKFGPISGLILNKFTEGDPKVRGKFKGSVFCIFKNKDDAEKYLAASAEETKFDGQEMVREWKKQHLEEQEKRFADKKAQIESSKISGSVLHLSTARTIDYSKIKDFFNQRQPVEYVDHQRGQREARVRFKAGVAKEVLDNVFAHNNNKLVIDGAQYKARVLDGKEEQTYFDTYWDTFVEAKNNKILRNMRNDPKTQFKYQPAKATEKKEVPTKIEEKPAQAHNKDTAKEPADKAESRSEESKSEKRPAEDESLVSKKLKADSTSSPETKSRSDAVFPDLKRGATDDGTSDTRKSKTADEEKTKL